MIATMLFKEDHSKFDFDHLVSELGKLYNVIIISDGSRDHFEFSLQAESGNKILIHSTRPEALFIREHMDEKLFEVCRAIDDAFGNTLIVSDQSYSFNYPVRLVDDIEKLFQIANDYIHYNDE